MFLLPASIISITHKQPLKSGDTIIPIIRLWGSRVDNSVVGGPIRLKFELVQDTMHVLITSKFKKD